MSYDQKTGLYSVVRAERGEASAFPAGYKIILINGIRQLVIDEEKRNAIKNSFELYANTTISVSGIQKMLSEDYGIVMARSNVARMLSNPFYYGLQLFRGQLHPHKYPPLISEELFDRVQEKKKKNTISLNHTKIKNFIYRRIVKCELCGTYLLSQVAKSNIYYFCSNKEKHPIKKYIEEREITNCLVNIYLKTLSQYADILIKHFNISKISFSDDATKFIIYAAYNAHSLFISRSHNDKVNIISTIFKEISVGETVKAELTPSFNDIIRLGIKPSVLISLFEDNDLIFNSDIEKIKGLIIQLGIIKADSSGCPPDYILSLAVNPISIEDLSTKLNIDMVQVRDIVTDLMFDNKIDEVMPGLWKTIV